MHAVWIHGNSVRAQYVGDPPIAQVSSSRPDGSSGGIAWSDIVGFPTGSGQTFRCRDSGGRGLGARVVPPPLSTYFHFSIPTPVILNDRRLSLLRVFVLWKSSVSGQAWLRTLDVFDGPNHIYTADITSAAPGDGTRGLADLVGGVTQFDIPSTPTVFFGIGVSVSFGFEADLDLTFTAAGADFM